MRFEMRSINESPILSKNQALKKKYQQPLCQCSATFYSYSSHPFLRLLFFLLCLIFLFLHHRFSYSFFSCISCCPTPPPPPSIPHFWFLPFLPSPSVLP